MGFFSRKPQQAQVVRKPAIWEHNPHFGRSFNVAVQMCGDSNELAALVAGYSMSTAELDRYQERMNELYFEEDMAAFEILEATPEARAYITSMYGADHPKFKELVDERVRNNVQQTRSLREYVRSTTELAHMTDMRDIIRHAQLVSAIEANAPDTLYGDLKNSPLIATMFGLATSRRRA